MRSQPPQDHHPPGAPMTLAPWLSCCASCEGGADPGDGRYVVVQSEPQSRGHARCGGAANRSPRVDPVPAADRAGPRVPLLIVPPTINKCYAMDLRPGRSLVDYLVQNGQQTFVISWHNPDARDANCGPDTYAGITCRCAAKCRRTWRPGSRQENLASWLHASLQKLHPGPGRPAFRWLIVAAHRGYRKRLAVAWA
jgi:Poly-beta-hydroxybutyrate polymerase (PhaC) N-terminus